MWLLGLFFFIAGIVQGSPRVDGEVSLIYLDGLGYHQSRSLGLGNAHVDFNYAGDSPYSLWMRVRPDAGIRDRDYSTRSGDSGMRELPAIRLLDAYQIRRYRPELGGWAVGVWDRPDDIDAHEIRTLEFGLEPELPRKFAGIKLQRQMGELAHAAVYLFQGDQDRGEELKGSSKTSDQAPSGKDGHLGVGLSLVDQGNVPWSIFLAQSREKLTLQKADFRRSLVDASLEFKGEVLSRDGGILISMRHERNSKEERVAAQKITTGSITSYLTSLSPGLKKAWHLTLAYGDGWRWVSAEDVTSSLRIRGYQFEEGISFVLDEVVQIDTGFSHERRTLIKDGVKTGGFDQLRGNREVERRFFVKMTYKILG